MKKAIRIGLLFALLPAFAGAQEAVISYAKGTARVQDLTGAKRNALIGRKVLVNETCTTGRASLLELTVGGDVITLRENTVFKLLAAQKKGQAQNAYACALGSMNVKVQRISGAGPRITSGSMSAGVRGTAFEVYAGVDGSSLILVTEGQVEVEAQGRAVLVDPAEGVEVKPGRAPGEKFKVRDPVDYSVWNDGKFAEFEKDPVAAIRSVAAQMKAYQDEVKTLWGEYVKYWMAFEAGDAVRKQIEKDEGEEAGLLYYREKIMPIRHDATLTFLNIRFDALSALSLRRYVAGRMYLLMHSRYYTERNNAAYVAFMNVYQNMMMAFHKELHDERTVGVVYPNAVRFLEDVDI